MVGLFRKLDFHVLTRVYGWKQASCFWRKAASPKACIRGLAVLLAFMPLLIPRQAPQSYIAPSLSRSTQNFLAGLTAHQAARKNKCRKQLGSIGVLLHGSATRQDCHSSRGYFTFWCRWFCWSRSVCFNKPVCVYRLEVLGWSTSVPIFNPV